MVSKQTLSCLFSTESNALPTVETMGAKEETTLVNTRKSKYLCPDYFVGFNDCYVDDNTCSIIELL